jgi:DNA primase
MDLALPALEPGQSLRFAILPLGQDPDDLLKVSGPEALARAVEAAEPLVDFLWRGAIETSDRSTPERRAEFERALAAAMARIGHERVRAHYKAELSSRLAALWASKAPPPASFRARQPFRSGPRRPGRPAYPEQAWQVATPVSRELRALAAGAGLAQAHARRERLILLALVNHPSLLDHAEALVECEFATPELDRLRREILDIAALCEGLDRDGLKNHLKARGHGALLSGLERQADRLGEWFVLPDAALQDVRTGFLQMMALHRKTVTLASALAAAELRLAEEPSERNLSHLNDIRAELGSSLGEEASVEGFGEASGRPGQIVA